MLGREFRNQCEKESRTRGPETEKKNSKRVEDLHADSSYFFVHPRKKISNHIFYPESISTRCLDIHKGKTKRNQEEKEKTEKGNLLSAWQAH